MSGIDPNASLVVSGIKNDLLILGNLQRFLFNFDASGFGLQSQFTPTSAMSANLFCEFENTNQRGYRFKHTTDTTNALGVFKLVSFTKQPSLVETEIFTCDQNTIHFSLSPNAPDPTTDLNIANKRFVDNHTWLTSQITNFDATVRTYRLNDFLAPSASLNFGGFNLLNLANPVNAQDATTKSYVDTLQKSVSLSGAISGAGMTGSSISTSFNLTLNQITSPTTSLNLNSQKIINLGTPTLSTDASTKGYVDSKTWTASQITDFDSQVRLSRLDQMATPTTSLNLNSQKIINLATPTLSTDAVTKAYVDSSIGGVSTSITLQGDISGTGSTGSAITTTFNRRLDQITSPTTSLNLNSQKIINLGTPTLSTDASTKGYVDSKTWTASQITDFDSQVRLSRLDQMATPTTSLNLNSQKIINLATPTLSTDAVTKNYADTSTVSPSRLTGYPSSSASFLRGDGTWASVSGGTVSSVGIIGGTGISVTGTPITSSGNITLSLSGIPIGSLSGYPSSVNSVLRGDGTWGAPNFVNIASLAGYPSNSSVFLRGDGAWATPSGGSTSLSSNSINVNTDGGNTNWLRRSINTTTGTQVFGLTSASYILESNNGESAGIGFDGGSDTCTIWTAGDGGTLLNIQDEDSSNARLAYVATNGAWTQVSSEKRKHSIREKANNNVLERFLSLSVKSYGYHYPIEDTLPETKKKRIERKTNKMSMGFVLEDMFKVFPNCLPDYYNALFQDAHNKELSLEKEIKDPENSGIDYTTLLCYFVMAFQEYVEKTNKVLLDLKEKMKVLEGGGHA